jgi:hypothetical protein
MKIGKMIFAVICVVVSVVMIAQLYGCGTLLYPERRGQKTGTVDVGIALMDALWLLVFIVPGVVAFAVDFTTGAIYVPGGTKRSSGPGETGKMVVVRVKPTELNEKTIKEIVMKQTGLKELEFKQAKIYRLDEKEEVEEELSKIAKSGYQAH